MPLHKRTSMKRLAGRSTALVAMGLAGTLALSACGPGTDSGGGDDEALTIQWLSARTMDEGMMKAIVKIAEEYKEDHPGFELDIESIPSRPDYLQKVRILASSGELPDWFDADTEPYFEEIVASGATADVGAIYDDIGVTDDFFAIGLDYPRLEDGSIHSMTFQGNIEHFWYNKDLFAQAGVEVPTTLDELLDVSKQLQDAGITPIAMDGVDRWPQMRYLAFLPFRQTGNEFIEGLKSGDAHMSDPEGIATATYFEEISQYFQDGWSSADYTAARDLFVGGGAAIYYVGSWELPSFVDEEGELLPQFGRFVMPAAGSDDATPLTDMFAHAGIGTAINAESDTPAMREWLTYLFSRFADVALFEFDTLPSLKPSTTEGMTQVQSELLEELEGVSEFAHVWDVRLDPDTVDVIARESTNLALGQLSPEEFAALVDQALAQNQ